MSSNTTRMLPDIDEDMKLADVRDRLGAFIASNGISADRHVYVLLSALSESVYKRLREELHPALAKDITYNSILDKLDKIYSPKKVFYARQTFYRAEQRDDETALAWHKRIENLAENCDFCYFTQTEAVRDRFICGLRSPQMFERLNDEFEPDMKVEKALRIVFGNGIGLSN